MVFLVEVQYFAASPSRKNPVKTWSLIKDHYYPITVPRSINPACGHGESFTIHFSLQLSILDCTWEAFHWAVNISAQFSALCTLQTLGIYTDED